MAVINRRRQGRELVLQALYAHEFTDKPPGEIIADLKRFNDLDPNTEEFVLRLLNKTLENRDWAKREIVARLKNWDYERVALIDRLILQMMMVEMAFLDDIPPKVSITEGVEIAKRYSTEESGAFINGILDSVFHTLDTLTQPVK